VANRGHEPAYLPRVGGSLSRHPDRRAAGIADPHKAAEAHLDDFALGDARTSSSATSYQSQGDLDADLATLHSPKLSSCYDQLIQKTPAT